MRVTRHRRLAAATPPNRGVESLRGKPVSHSNDDEVVPIHKTGRVVAGRHVGWLTRVEQTQGGYLILWMRLDAQGNIVEGYDDWLLPKDLAGFYERHGQRVDWNF
jgi:hypothetical protein